jgi:hypothetical protein
MCIGFKQKAKQAMKECKAVSVAVHHERPPDNIDVQPTFDPPPHVSVAWTAVGLVSSPRQLSKFIKGLYLTTQLAHFSIWRYRRVFLQDCFQRAIFHSTSKRFYRQSPAASSACHAPLLHTTQAQDARSVLGVIQVNICCRVVVVHRLAEHRQRGLAAKKLETPHQGGNYCSVNESHSGRFRGASSVYFGVHCSTARMFIYCAYLHTMVVHGVQ